MVFPNLCTHDQMYTPYEKIHQIRIIATLAQIPQICIRKPPHKKFIDVYIVAITTHPHVRTRTHTHSCAYAYAHTYTCTQHTSTCTHNAHIHIQHTHTHNAHTCTHTYTHNTCTHALARQANGHSHSPLGMSLLFVAYAWYAVSWYVSWYKNFS